MGRREYVNGEPVVLSAAAMVARVQADPNFPAKEKGIATWAIRSACRWSGRDPAAVPFSASSARGLLADTSPGKAGVSKKTLQNARSAIERLLRFYSLEATTLFSVPLTTELAEWFGRFSKYEKAGTSRFLRFLSVRGRTIGDVVDDDAEAFLATLNAELPEKAARAKHKIALHAWNRLGASYPDWPGRPLTRRLDREAWALSWERFPPSLKMAVDVLFAVRQVHPDLFEEQPLGSRLKPTTVRNRVEHLRIGASILCTRCSLRPSDLTCLSDLCRPDRFKAIIGAIVERHEGKVTAYAEQIAVTLLQAAQECGALSDAEVAEVKALKHRVYRRGLSDRKYDVGPDQQILDELDDSDRMDTLLSLPTKTVMGVQLSGRIDRAAALEIQMALALQMWLAAPLRITNFVMLRLDEHVHRVAGGRKARIIIRVPGTETKNGKPVEHYLHDAAADLLELYLTVYRPLLAEPASPWLFPGRNNGHKRAAVLARQTKDYIWEGAGIRFHPHLIRKIITKIQMDHDPGAIEIVRIMLGHADTRTTRSAYTQAQVRSAQTIYLKAMEQRRLAAIGPLQPAVQRASAPTALRLGKGLRVQQGGKNDPTPDPPARG